MGKSVRITVCIALVLSIFLSLTACYNNSYKEIYSACEEFVPALTGFDHKEVKNLSVSSYEYDRETIDVFDYPMYTPEENYRPIGKIINSITYEIDASTISSGKDSGSVDVIFTMLDYNELWKDDSTDKTIEKTIRIDFVNEDGTWRVSNTSEVVLGLYYFIKELNSLRASV